MCLTGSGFTSIFCCLSFFATLKMCVRRCTQPVSLSSHRWQEPQSGARNHVFAALDSVRLEPRLFQVSFVQALLNIVFFFRLSQESAFQRITMDPVSPDQLLVPSHSALRLDTVVRQRKGRTNRCAPVHFLLESYLGLPGLLRVAAFDGIGPRWNRRLMSLRGTRSIHMGRSHHWS